TRQGAIEARLGQEVRAGTIAVAERGDGETGEALAEDSAGDLGDREQGDARRLEGEGAAIGNREGNRRGSGDRVADHQVGSVTFAAQLAAMLGPQESLTQLSGFQMHCNPASDMLDDG